MTDEATTVKELIKTLEDGRDGFAKAAERLEKNSAPDVGRHAPGGRWGCGAPRAGGRRRGATERRHLRRRRAAAVLTPPPLC